MISKETIEQVLMRNDIESVIGGYIALKRAGSNLKGLCPFHSEKTPSFTVYPSDNSFYCFGCGAGGDAITFIRKRENLDYPDAVEFLAKRAGITIVRDERNGVVSNHPKYDREKMFKMNVDAAKYFNKCLFYTCFPGLCLDTVGSITCEKRAVLHYRYAVGKCFCLFHVVGCQNDGDLSFEGADDIP